MTGHRSPISGIAVWNNELVATAGYDNYVVLWNANSKEMVAKVCHDHLVNQCAFSPCGRYLATASSDHTARLWSVPKLKLCATFKDHEDDVEMVVFHPKLPMVATASRDCRMRVFNFDGKLLAVFQGHAADINSVEWTDNNQLITSSDDTTVRKWDFDKASIMEVIDMNGVETDTLAITSNDIMYTGNDLGEIAIIRRSEVNKMSAHCAGIKRLVYSRTKKLLVSMGYDRTLKLWHVLSDGSLEFKQMAYLPAVIWPRSCAFKGECELVFGTFGSSYASFNFETCQWDLSSIDATWGINAVTKFQNVTYSVGDAGVVRKNSKNHLALGSPCNFLTAFGDRVITGGQMGIVFDAESGETLHTHRSPINCAATFEQSGVLKLIVGTYTGEGLVFAKKANGQICLEQTIQLHENAIKGIACNQDMIFSVCATGAAAYHSIQSLQAVRIIVNAHDKIANGCAVLAGGQFVSASRDLKLRIWNAQPSLSNNLALQVIDSPHTHSIKCVTTSTDGSLIATASYNGVIAVFNISTNKWIQVEHPTRAGISSIVFDGSQFLASSYDGQTYQIAPNYENF